MRLTLEDLKRVTVGAVRIWQTEEGYRFSKLTEGQERAYAALSDFLLQNAVGTTGVRLDFHTDSTYIRYRTGTADKYELKLDGLLVGELVTEAGGEYTVMLPSDGELHRVTLYMPSFYPGVLGYLELSDGAAVTSHTYDRRMLFIGDSITQGWNSEVESLCYSVSVSERLNAESIIQGVGGGFYDISTVEPLDFDPDTVIVAFGTNDSYKFGLSEIGDRARAVLTRLVTLYPRAAINVITPPWHSDFEEPQPYGHFSLAGERIGEVGRELGLNVIDGLSLVPHKELFFSDFLHPNSLGFQVYTNNLMPTLKLGTPTPKV